MSGRVSGRVCVITGTGGRSGPAFGRHWRASNGDDIDAEAEVSPLFENAGFFPIDLGG
ncbi:MAG: hypothetical protein QOG01_1728 [Pseudonocardiales bacterium]|jgi:hypothetical protein|nr:hypothetical protein [Pseudonocardiales bacterium]